MEVHAKGNWLSLIAYGFASELEERFPGIVRAVLERISTKHSQAAVVQLRGRRTEAEVLAEYEHAVAWLTATAAVLDHAKEARKARKKRERKRKEAKKARAI